MFFKEKREKGCCRESLGVNTHTHTHMGPYSEQELPLLVIKHTHTHTPPPPSHFLEGVGKVCAFELFFFFFALI